jgi:hypothetical protein
MVKLGELLNIHSSIADSAYQPGMKLVCNNCGSFEAIEKCDFARYLSQGWPKCCEQTMELITKEKSNG